MTFELQPYQQEIVDGIWARALAVAEDHIIGKRIYMTKNEKLLQAIDELYWDKAGASPHEMYRRERQHRKFVKLALSKGLIEP